MGTNSCEKCNKNNQGEEYTIYLGKYIESWSTNTGFGSMVNTSKYQILGSKSIFICNRCINGVLYPQIFMRILLAVVMMAVALGIGVLSSAQDVNITLMFIMGIPAFALVISAIVFLMNRRDFGEKQAIQIYENKKSGSPPGANVFWTTKQYRGLQKSSNK